MLDTSDLACIPFLDLHKHSIYEIALWLHHQQVDTIWIEDVHSFPNMSAKSNFGFGRSVGMVMTISQIITKGIIANKVTPKKWQKFVGVTAKGQAIKKNVAELGAVLYPTANVYGPQGGLLDGRSDALLIAHYGLNHKE